MFCLLIFILLPVFNDVVCEEEEEAGFALVRLILIDMMCNHRLTILSMCG